MWWTPEWPGRLQHSQNRSAMHLLARQPISPHRMHWSELKPCERVRRRKVEVGDAFDAGGLGVGEYEGPGVLGVPLLRREPYQSRAIGEVCLHGKLRLYAAHRNIAREPL